MGKLFVLAVNQTHLTKYVPHLHWVILMEHARPNRLMSIMAKSYTFDCFEGSSRLMTNPDDLLSHSLLKINIGAIKQSSISQLKQLLNLVTGSSSESWLAVALTSLQHAGLVESFSTIKFLRFANDAVETHRSSYPEHVEQIDYIALLQDNQQVKQMFQRHQDADPEPGSAKKRTFMGFWASSPGDVHQPVQRVNGLGQPRDPYGGLM